MQIPRDRLAFSAGPPPSYPCSRSTLNCRQSHRRTEPSDYFYWTRRRAKFVARLYNTHCHGVRNTLGRYIGVQTNIEIATRGPVLHGMKGMSPGVIAVILVQMLTQHRARNTIFVRESEWSAGSATMWIITMILMNNDCWWIIQYFDYRNTFVLCRYIFCLIIQYTRWPIKYVFILWPRIYNIQRRIIRGNKCEGSGWSPQAKLFTST